MIWKTTRTNLAKSRKGLLKGRSKIFCDYAQRFAAWRIGAVLLTNSNKMKTYNEIQEQIEKLEQVIAGLKKELTLHNSSFMSDKIKRQISMLESDIETLKWVMS